jgi:hypothetical protein
VSRWLTCIFAVLAALLAGTPSRAAEIEALEIVEAGLYRAQTTGHISAPHAVNGQTQIITDAVFYSTTPKVPAREGIRFGTRFRVVGSPAQQTVTLRSVWRIPEPGIRNPTSGILYRDSMAEFTTTIGALYMRGFSFSAAWQILCGDWIQEVWFGERKLLSQTFTVEDCRGVPTAARRAAAPAG